MVYGTLVAAFTFVLGYLSAGFVMRTPEGPIPYFDVAKYNRYIYYIQSSMLQNTVSITDLRDVDAALEWVGERMGDGSRLLVHSAFRGQALLILGYKSVLDYGYGDPDVVAQQAFERGFSRVYLIWWVDGKGWHGQSSISSSFTEVYRSGRVAIYVMYALA